MVKHYGLRGIMVHCVCYQQSIANKKHCSNASRFIRIVSFTCKQLHGGRKICASDCKVQVSSSSSLMNYLREIYIFYLAQCGSLERRHKIERWDDVGISWQPRLSKTSFSWPLSLAYISRDPAPPPTRDPLSNNIQLPSTQIKLNSLSNLTSQKV